MRSVSVHSDRADGLRIRKYVATEKLWPFRADLSSLLFLRDGRLNQRLSIVKGKRLAAKLLS